VGWLCIDFYDGLCVFVGIVSGLVVLHNEAMKKKITSPPTVTILEKISATSNFDSGRSGESKNRITASRTPIPAGAPGVTRPINHATIKAPQQSDIFVGSIIWLPYNRKRIETKRMLEQLRKIKCQIKARITGEAKKRLSPIATRKMIKIKIAPMNRGDVAGRRRGMAKMEKSDPVKASKPSSHMVAFARTQPLISAAMPIAWRPAKCIILLGTYLASCVIP